MDNLAAGELVDDWIVVVVRADMADDVNKTHVDSMADALTTDASYVTLTSDYTAAVWLFVVVVVP